MEPGPGLGRVSKTSFLGRESTEMNVDPYASGKKGIHLPCRLELPSLRGLGVADSTLFYSFFIFLFFAFLGLNSP